MAYISDLKISSLILGMGLRSEMGLLRILSCRTSFLWSWEKTKGFRLTGLVKVSKSSLNLAFGFNFCCMKDLAWIICSVFSSGAIYLTGSGSMLLVVWRLGTRIFLKNFLFGLGGVSCMGIKL